MLDTSVVSRITHAVFAWLDRAVDFLVLALFFGAVVGAPFAALYQYMYPAGAASCALSASTPGLNALAYYVHLVPVAVLLIIAGSVLFTSHELRIKRVFALFIGGFSLWLIGNLLTWVSGDVAIVYAARTTLWFLELVFFVLGVYFTASLIYAERVPLALRLFLPVVLLAPIAFLVWSGEPRAYLETLCEAPRHGFLAAYVLYAEVALLGLLAYFWARVPGAAYPPRQLYAIIASLFMFLGTFAIGSFVVWLTGQYEFLFYGLLALPVFIIVLVYSVTNLELFRVQSFGIQVLVYLILLLISAQFLFMDSVTDRLLIGITLVFAGVFGYLFQQSALREVRQRHKIEVLAEELEDTNERQETLLHFVGHEMKGFLTKDQGALAAFAEGDFAELSDTGKSFAARALEGTRTAVRSITDILTASNLKKGTTALQMVPFDLWSLVSEQVERSREAATEKGLTLTFNSDIAAGPYLVKGDPAQLGDHVFRNLIENAINYTPAGSVEVSLTKEPSKIIFMVKDSGVGITDEDKARLFTEGGHGKESQKVNAHSTGYGLFIAKNIVDAHGGSISASSEGPGKGSTFTVELPV